MTCDTILGCIAHLNHTLIGSLLSLLIALLAFLALVVQVRLVSVYVVIVVEVPAKCIGQAGGQAAYAAQEINRTYYALTQIAAKYGARIPRSVVGQ